MLRGLRRFQESGQSHLDPSASLRDFGSGLRRPLDASTFSCYCRRPYFATVEVFELFVHCLEDMRRRFELCVYGYVVMPEHVHLLLSEPPRTSWPSLKLSFANGCEAAEFTVKLRYLHRNPVKRGLVSKPEEW